MTAFLFVKPIGQTLKILKNPTRIFHVLSYLQHPFGFAAMVYYVIFMKALFNGETDWSTMNNVLLLVGLSMSFSTLQDSSKATGKLSKRIWSSKLFGMIALIAIAILAVGFIAGGLYYNFSEGKNITSEVSVGMTVLGIGFIGLLKTSTEIFKNHIAASNS